MKFRAVLPCPQLVRLGLLMMGSGMTAVKKASDTSANANLVGYGGREESSVEGKPCEASLTPAVPSSR